MAFSRDSAGISLGFHFISQDLKRHPEIQKDRPGISLPVFGYLKVSWDGSSRVYPWLSLVYPMSKHFRFSEMQPTLAPRYKMHPEIGPESAKCNQNYEHKQTVHQVQEGLLFFAAAAPHCFAGGDTSGGGVAAVAQSPATPSSTRAGDRAGTRWGRCSPSPSDDHRCWVHWEAEEGRFCVEI